MSMPAARIGDVTAHGGVIIIGAPTVLVAEMPAARLGDIHSCPMTTPTPHVGGPIVSASTTVLIEGIPAARVGDSAACNGPPDVIAVGCPTVLIGSGGSGSSSATSGAQEGNTAPPTTKTFSYKVLAKAKPIENAKCRLFIDGEEHSVSTDSSGLIEQEVPSDAGVGFLIVSEDDSDDELHVPMLVGTLKPLNEPKTEDDIHTEAAARQRLMQLGFFEPSVPYHYEVALKDYQLSRGIDPNKPIDKQTCDALNGSEDED